MIPGIHERMGIAVKKTGMTFVEVAKKGGFDRKVFFGESTNTSLRSDTLRKICAITNCDANWLLGLTNEYKPLRELK